MIRIGLAGLEPPQGGRNRKKNLELIFNNPRSSNLSESSPDPKFVPWVSLWECNIPKHILERVNQLKH